MLRTLKFVRYLPALGWRVSVITAEPSTYEIRDESMNSQVPPETRVVRTRCPDARRRWSWKGAYPALLALPDVWIGWLPYAVRAARALIAQDRVDVLYSTSPHATAHLIAASVARTAKLPWVADFRDPWIEEPPEPGAPAGPVYRMIDRMLERRTIRQADAVVSTTRHLSQTLRKRYPEVRRDKFQVIANGYDEADFVAIDAVPPSRGPLLRMVHAGSLNADFRDPRPLFASLARLIDANLIAARELEIVFLGAGPFADTLKHSLALGALQNVVTFTARVPYEISLRELRSADVLILLQASDDTVGLVPAKLYEYFRSQTPTLALVRAGATSDVLAEVGGGIVCDPAAPDSVDDALRTIVAEWRAGKLARRVADPMLLRRYDRRSLTAELARTFDRLLEHHSA